MTLILCPIIQVLEEANPFMVRVISANAFSVGRCIRADHELVVVGAIDYNHRGFSSRPATLNETPLENSNCTFCGTCVSVCPTGALAAKNGSLQPEHRKRNPSPSADSAARDAPYLWNG